MYRQASAKTKTEARAKLAALKAAVAKAGTAVNGAMTVRQALGNLLASPPPSWKSPQTMAVNKTHTDRIIAALGQVKLTDLTAQQIETRLLRPMAEQGMATTIMIRTGGLLRVALKKAMRDNGLGRNVAELAEVTGGTSRESRSMAVEQAETMLAAAGVTGSYRNGFTFDASRATPLPAVGRIRGLRDHARAAAG